MDPAFLESKFQEGLRKLTEIMNYYQAHEINIKNMERLDSIRDAKSHEEVEAILAKAVDRYQIHCLNLWSQKLIPGPHKHVTPLTEWEKLEKEARDEDNCAARLEGKKNFTAAEKHRKAAEKLHKEAEKLRKKMERMEKQAG